MVAAILQKLAIGTQRTIGLVANSHIYQCAAITLLLSLGSWIVYATGGTASSYSYCMLIPVLLSASWYALPGGLLIALAASIALAFMPLDASTGADQSPLNYSIRIALYLLIGGVAGWLSHLRLRAFAAHREVARTDHHTGLPNEVALNGDLLERVSHPKRGGTLTTLIIVKVADLTDVIEALGLEAADELMVSLSQRLNQVIRGGAPCYHVTPSEFWSYLILRHMGSTP